MPEAKLNDNVNDVTSYSSASSSTENAADLHNYNGFDEHTEARIQKTGKDSDRTEYAKLHSIGTQQKWCSVYIF